MTTLADVCDMVMDELGALQTFMASAADVSTDAARTVIASSMANDNLTATSYGRYYLYPVDGALQQQQRQVRAAGFATSGAFTVSQVWASTPQSGVTWKLSTPLPRISYQGIRGVRGMVNRATRKLWIPRRYPFVGVANQLQYSLSAAWWLDHPKRVLRLLDPPTVIGGNPVTSWRTWKLRLDAEAPYLEIGTAYGTGDAFALMVHAPANSRLRLCASAYATIAAGAVTGIAGVTGGYYTSTPTVTLSGGGGSGATATATLTNNAVSGYIVTAPGSGYTSAPTVTIAAGAWNDQASPSAGMLADADEVDVEPGILAQCTLLEAYRYLAQRPDLSQERAHWLDLARDQEQLVAGLKIYDWKAERQPLDGGQSADTAPYWSKGWSP